MLTEVLWRLYCGAILEVELSASPSIIVPLKGGADAVPQILSPLLDGDAAHLITGWNPGSIVAGEGRNRAANLALVAQVDRLGVRTILPATGYSPDRSYLERGFLVIGLTREEAREVARDFGQIGFYEVSTEGVVCVDCESGETRPVDGP